MGMELQDMKYMKRARGGMIELQSTEQIGQGFDHDVLQYLGPCANIEF